MKTWLEYFKRNRTERHSIPWNEPVRLRPELRRPLIRSLQRFQVGESGEGRHLRQQAATVNDPVYYETIDLFIREEQEHARLLAGLLHRLEAPLLRHHWSDACFVALRRVFNLHAELLVLLVPEMIAQRFFKAVHDGSDDPATRAVAAQILHDEQGHVEFHIDFLRSALAPASIARKALLRAGWRLLFRLACVVVILDHGPLLRATGVSGPRFWWDSGLIFDETAARIFCTVTVNKPFPVFAEPARACGVL